MQPHHLAVQVASNSIQIFPFDFNMFWVNLNTGQTQAAYTSVNGAAPSTPRAKKWTITCRAGQICKTSLILGPQRWDIARRTMPKLRMQAQFLARAKRAAGSKGTDRAGRAMGANAPQPALFHFSHAAPAALSLTRLCASTRHSGSLELPQHKGAKC